MLQPIRTRRRLFALHYADGLPAVEAARRCGYRDPAHAGVRLARHPEVQRHLQRIGDAHTTAGRQRRFAEAYAANGGDGRAAAIEAGYSAHSAVVTACRLLRRPTVALQVAKARERGVEPTGEATRRRAFARAVVITGGRLGDAAKAAGFSASAAPRLLARADVRSYLGDALATCRSSSVGSRLSAAYEALIQRAVHGAFDGTDRRCAGGGARCLLGPLRCLSREGRVRHVSDSSGSSSQPRHRLG